MKEIAAGTGPGARHARTLTSRIRIADEAVARVAAWPIEALAPFAAPRLAALVREVEAAEREVRGRTAPLLEELYAAVSKASDGRARAWLLEVKREVYNGVRPWRELPAREVEMIAAAMPGLTTRLEAERGERLRLLELRAWLAREYETELSAQRLALGREADGPRFARALTIANPALAARWRGRPRDTRRTKGTRHLEGAVLHYLLRAVGRTTPSGDWAGVAPVRLSSTMSEAEAPRDAPESERATAEAERTTVEATCVPARFVAAPDLLPFRQIVECLARRARYLASYPLRMDPAAHQDGAHWWGLDVEGVWCGVPSDALVALVTDNFVDGASRRIEPLVEFLAARTGSPERARALLEAAVGKLIEAGVLRSSLEFPAAPSSPWAALEAVTPALLEPERSAWACAVERCREACAELAARYEELAPESVALILEGARSAVGELCERAGVEVEVPEQIIKLDRRAPFEIRWSPRALSELRAAVVEVLACHAEAGGAEAFRRELLRGLRGTRRTLAEAVRNQDDLRGRATATALAAFGAWACGRGGESPDESTSAQAPADDDARPGPYGTLMFLLTGVAPSACFTWGRPTPDFASCRAYELLRRTEHDLALVGALHDGAVEPLEVVGIDAPNPNATVRLEARRSRQLGRHAKTAARFSELLLEVDADCRPWLSFEGEAGRCVPVYSVAAGVGLSDPAGRFLMRLAMAHGWEFLSFGVPFSAAAPGAEGEAPAQVFEGGSVLGLRQLILPADFVGRLRQESGLGQYRMWRELIEGAGVGDWVWLGPAAPPDAPRVLVRTDSPLILEAVLNRLEPDCGELVLAQMPGDPSDWPVRDAEGKHYLCELAVTWVDSEHWREVCSW